MFGYEEHCEAESGPAYGSGAYWAQEAALGAQWAREDGKPCPCNGSGWLNTNIDTWVRCGCGVKPTRHPEDETPDDVPVFTDEELNLISLAEACGISYWD
jgi:hypothetical protein